MNLYFDGTEVTCSFATFDCSYIPDLVHRHAWIVVHHISTDIFVLDAIETGFNTGMFKYACTQVHVIKIVTVTNKRLVERVTTMHHNSFPSIP